jgi:hypothetical protein
MGLVGARWAQFTAKTRPISNIRQMKGVRHDRLLMHVEAGTRGMNDVHSHLRDKRPRRGARVSEV